MSTGSGFTFTEDKNPFEDPAVLQAINAQQHEPQIADATSSTASTTATLPAPQSQQVSSDVAIVHPTVEPPPPYSLSSSWETNAATASANEQLRMRQEELERKADELQRREDEIQRNMQYQVRRNNFPPLPSGCPVQPCFYQDISVDIPLEFQKVVRTIYYLWLAYVGTLAVNVIGSLAYFIATIKSGGSQSAGVTFGLSIFYFLLFTPCSFVCWFRPVYKAFRSDSSFNFFVFFFVFFAQFCATIFQSLGLDGWGTVGFISSLSMFTQQTAGANVAGVIMIIIGVMFAACAFLDMIMLIQVHRIYRSTGASFAKAQEEFAHGMMGNQAIQRAAGNFAASAAHSSVEQTWSGSRY